MFGTSLWFFTLRGDFPHLISSPGVSGSPRERPSRPSCPDVPISALSLFPAQHHPCLPVAPSPGSGDREAQPVVASPGDTLQPFALGSGSSRHASGCRGSAARGETRAAFRGWLLPRSPTDPRGCWRGGVAACAGGS